MMGKFLSELDASKFSKNEWKLNEPLVYNSNTVGVIVVPEGFVTNFGSVPRLPLMYLLFGGVGDEACTLHDWLYTAPHNPIRCGVTVDRSTADKVFRGVVYECLRVDDSNISGMAHNLISLGVAWAMWAGVRIGGASHWNVRKEE